jgi:ATP-dependent DNA helicase RecG
LVEGRYPNLYVSSGVAAVTEDKSLYIKHRAFDNTHYKRMIISFIKKFGAATRQDIDKLLLDKLSDALDEEQKNKKIDNLLQEMARKDRTIRNIGSRRWPEWTLI